MGWKNTACSTCFRAPCTCVKSSAPPTAQGQPLSKYVTRPWHHLYNKARWKNPVTGLRAAVLRKYPICFKCNRAPSTHADHIVDHKGNERLFYDFNNLQGLCESCHSEKTARERTGEDTRPALVDGKVYNYSS